MPGPERGRELLGRASHQRGGRDHAERRGDEDRDVARVRELEHDRDRDQRREQVGPALGAEAGSAARRGGPSGQVGLDTLGSICAEQEATAGTLSGR